MLLMTDPTDTRDAEDIVDRLRSFEAVLANEDAALMDEAADEITRLRALLEGHSGAREPVAWEVRFLEMNGEWERDGLFDYEEDARAYCKGYGDDGRVVPLYATPEPAEMDGERIEGWAARDEDGERAFRTAEWFRNQGLAAHPDYERRATLILAPPDSTGEEG